VGDSDASGDAAVSDPHPAPMRSPVNWALLGLIIERESYAYELARRFQNTYANTLTLSSTSHVYTALGVLQGRSLIEQLPGARRGRQPKPSYRATALGLQGYAEWLVGFVSEDRKRQVMFVLGLSALARNVNWVAEVLERCEQAWLAQEGEKALVEGAGVPDGPGAELASRILSQENGLTVAAKLTWVRDVRQMLNDLVSGDEP
jgi:DNA-binding PadR family transcriptional regulator